ncbi:MAG TPA: bifunctional DNA-formamidopyrimidine glycosylase/DNA-(apurinic or apyrimidinic site) lyase [Pyrinomonadaceae bacterium]|nr:bifunctional DNA-formamidopyrimidine glycosylase/DNA-(apurinic or apyrimidinic site) lyase [Pyrinomonadaceae bacterium]
MPELPEVEHVVRALRQAVTGRRIMAAQLRLPRTAPLISSRIFARKLKGARIDGVSRRGKYILIELSGERVLIVHLRMTGKFVRLSHEQKLPPYSHAIFYLDDDTRLVFCDMRQFGRMNLVSAAQLHESAELSILAPEPLSETFTIEHLQQVLSRSHRSLKQLLLDQTRVLGLGNIYASEALFLARISPFAESSKLSKPRVVRLHGAIQQVLEEAITGGSTLRIDLDDEGSSYIGSAERFWRVYEREGEPCIRCGSRIRRAVQGGRSTYYCGKCQR